MRRAAGSERSETLRGPLLGLRTAASQDLTGRLFRRFRSVLYFEDSIGVRDALQGSRFGSIKKFGDTFFSFRSFPNSSLFEQRLYLCSSFPSLEYPIPSEKKMSNSR